MRNPTSAAFKLSKMPRLSLTRLTSPNARFFVLVAFIIIVSFMGGGSRPDIQSLVVLRPVAFIFLAYALLVAKSDEIRPVMVPLALIGLLALLMVIQLVPLPPDWWENLPGRQPFAVIAEQIAMSDVWRPISMVPSRTLNSLFSLVVPLAMILLCAIQAPEKNRRIVGVLIAVGVISALLGALQLAGSNRSALYLYRITNADMPVGLLANRNHQAVLLSISLLMSAWYFVSFRLVPDKKLEWARFSMLLMPFLFLPLIVLTGSRLGILAGAIATFASGLMLLYRGDIVSGKSAGSKIAVFVAKKRALIGMAALVALVGLLAFLFSDSLAVRRLVSARLFDDLRADLLPVLLTMAREHIVFGTGFGSFENVFRSYESTELLRPNYLNNAHNDWLQLVIEAGVAGIVLLASFLLWAGRAIIKGYSSGSLRKKCQTDLCFGILLILAIASMVDYPLRVPMMMVLACFCIVRLAHVPNR